MYNRVQAVPKKPLMPAVGVVVHYAYSVERTDNDGFWFPVKCSVEACC